jgi:charged multivesicular body protein 6
MGSFINCIKRNSPTQEEAPRERPKLSQEDKAILDCKQARDKIKAYIKRLEENEKSQRERAKELLKNKEKDKAKYCLSQSKMYKMQIENSQNQLAAVEEQINRLDMVKTQQNVFNVLENTNKVLRELQKEVNVERLENIGEDLNDIKAANDEITNFFKNHNVDIEENDQQINNELEKLMKMENYQIESSLPDAGNTNVANNVENQQVENKEKEQRVLLEA